MNISNFKILPVSGKMNFLSVSPFRTFMKLHEFNRSNYHYHLVVTVCCEIAVISLAAQAM